MKKNDYNVENVVMEGDILHLYVDGNLNENVALDLKSEYVFLMPGASDAVIYLNGIKYEFSSEKESKAEDEVTKDTNDDHKTEDKDKKPQDKPYISTSAKELKALKEREMKLEIQNRMKYKKTKTKKREKDPSVIHGKLIKQPSQPIDSVCDINRKVCYKGEVFNYEERATKSEYTIVTFSLVDAKSGIGVKYFLKENELEKHKAPKNGDWVKVLGSVVYDNYSNENVMNASSLNKTPKPDYREDKAFEKRVELKMHSNMTEMSGVDSVENIIKTAVKWGHKSIAITDEDVIQGYPIAMGAIGNDKLGIPADFKVIYGLHASVIDKTKPFVNIADDVDFNTDIVVFDIETTGLSSVYDEIIEIGAVKLRNLEKVDEFSTLVKPLGAVSKKTIELTGIDDSMLVNEPLIEEVLPKFMDFCKGAVMVAHNASFDIGFVSYQARVQNLEFNPPVLDTLALSRTLYPEFKKHGLDAVSKRLNVILSRHHRAEADVSATVGILKAMFAKLNDMNINTFGGLNKHYAANTPLVNYSKTSMTMLVKDGEVLHDFYKMISRAHIEDFHNRPLYQKCDVEKTRRGLFIASSAIKGEVIEALNSKLPEEKIKEIISFYDYVEVAPPSAVLTKSGRGRYGTYNQYVELVKKIINYCKELDVPVVAVSNAYYVDSEDMESMNILMYSASSFIKFKKSKGKKLRDSMTSLHLRTTDEMLSEFYFLEPELAHEIVVTNSNKIADEIPIIKPIPSGTFPPIVEGSDKELKDICYQNAHDLYGDELPEIVSARLERELNSVIGNGYAVMYIIARKLVLKSNEDGYLVGSRGSVGSSFAATMSGITEVNPLPPHYYCLKKPCHYVEFYDKNDVLDGYDLPQKKCPVCGEDLKGEGHNIPFETFLGFEGEKEPDIDLNFAGPYQSTAHAYTGVLFGDEYVYKAGTISTVQDKKAYGYVKAYYEDFGLEINRHYINKKVSAITGARNTTGQHAGGIMVVPHYKKIYDFCPVQYPSNNPDKGTITTHFDYHSISGRILKLDILGHDAPTIIKRLEENTGFSAENIPFDDVKTMQIFSGIESLNISDPAYDETSGSLGIPEFGTLFVRGILRDTKPKKFFELAKICGVAHGTNVWNDNAETLIKSGTCTLMESICVRDEIMLYLIRMGLNSKDAFDITEKVRKGKGLSPEHENTMVENNVPEWYIESCKKISYMFPLAHSVAYVMMSFRIAYYKVYYPLAFYSSYFSSKIDSFDPEIILGGKYTVWSEIDRLKDNKSGDKKKDLDKLYVLEIAKEMMARGYKFKTCDIINSEAEVFKIVDDSLLIPFKAVTSLGGKAANNLVEYRKHNELYSIEDLKKVDGLNKTAIENLKTIGSLEGWPESSQFTIDMFIPTQQNN